MRYSVRHVSLHDFHPQGNGLGQGVGKGLKCQVRGRGWVLDGHLGHCAGGHIPLAFRWDQRRFHFDRLHGRVDGERGGRERESEGRGGEEERGGREGGGGGGERGDGERERERRERKGRREGIKRARREGERGKERGGRGGRGEGERERGKKDNYGGKQLWLIPFPAGGLALLSWRTCPSQLEDLPFSAGGLALLSWRTCPSQLEDLPFSAGGLALLSWRTCPSQLEDLPFSAGGLALLSWRYPSRLHGDYPSRLGAYLGVYPSRLGGLPFSARGLTLHNWGACPQGQGLALSSIYCAQCWPRGLPFLSLQGQGYILDLGALGGEKLLVSSSAVYSPNLEYLLFHFPFPPFGLTLPGTGGRGTVKTSSLHPIVLSSSHDLLLLRDALVRTFGVGEIEGTRRTDISVWSVVLWVGSVVLWVWSIML